MHPCTKHIFLSVLRNSSSQDCLKMSSRKTGLDHPSFACNDVLYCVRYQGPCLCIILWEILLLQPYCEWDKGVMKVSAKRGQLIFLFSRGSQNLMDMQHSLDGLQILIDSWNLLTMPFSRQIISLYLVRKPHLSVNICRSKHSSSLPSFFPSLYLSLVERNFNVIYEIQEEKIFVTEKWDTSWYLVCSAENN